MTMRIIKNIHRPALAICHFMRIKDSSRTARCERLKLARHMMGSQGPEQLRTLIRWEIVPVIPYENLIGAGFYANPNFPDITKTAPAVCMDTG